MVPQSLTLPCKHGGPIRVEFSKSEHLLFSVHKNVRQRRRAGRYIEGDPHFVPSLSRSSGVLSLYFTLDDPGNHVYAPETRCVNKVYLESTRFSSYTLFTVPFGFITIPVNLT